VQADKLAMYAAARLQMVSTATLPLRQAKARSWSACQAHMSLAAVGGGLMATVALASK